MHHGEQRARMIAELNKAAKRRQPVLVRYATVYPPDKRGYWRIQMYVQGKAYSRSGGRTAETALAAAERLLNDIEKRSVPARSGVLVRDLVGTYLELGGRSGQWTERTRRDRSADFSPLVEMFGELPVEDVTIDTVRTFINTAGTAKRHAHLKNVTGTFVRWGHGAGHFPENLDRQIAVLSHVGRPLRPSRRAQASQFAHDLDGEVPTHIQVEQWAQKCEAMNGQVGWMIRIAAATGLRFSELLALTLDSEQAKNGRGNLIDLATGQIRVICQVSETTGQFAPPKRGKRRTVNIPPDNFLPNIVNEATDSKREGFLGPGPGITINNWLASQAPRVGLLFPNSKGGFWSISNLRKRVLAPAADQLGWRMDEYETNAGTRALYRFTMHSLRARYATTAAGEWGFTRPQLQAQGGWEAGVVERFYQRFDDHVTDSVSRLFGRNQL